MRVDSGSTTEAQYQVALLRKVNETVEQQGQQALQLIEGSSPEAAAPLPPHVGTRLNIRA